MATRKKITEAFFLLLRSAAVFAAVVGIYYLFVDFLVSDHPYLQLPNKFRDGSFGDTFGSLNALFSGLAFAGVVVTLLMQRKDLTVQRRDIEEARQQASHQKIESQFYSMLTLQQNVVSGFDVKRKGELLHSGRDCFKVWYRFLESEYRGSLSEGYAKLEDSYELMWLKYQGDLSLYFRSLYSVFRFISESGHPDTLRFGSVVRSFLSDFELVILYYNCLNKKGEPFKKYVSQFKVFDNLDVEMLIDVGELVEFDASSFGANEHALYIRSILLNSRQ
jgi:hypothetical protein